jgi:hypothetical protein
MRFSLAMALARCLSRILRDLHHVFVRVLLFIYTFSPVTIFYFHLTIERLVWLTFTKL